MAGRRRKELLGIAIGLVPLFGACDAPRPSEDRVSVVLVTLDTTRADRIGCYGNRSIRTPNLDRIAGDGVLFENAFTPVPSTLPSHCSIMTGAYPARHQVHDNGIYFLRNTNITLAERFQEHGYATGAFVSAFVLNREFGLDQGFSVYDDETKEPLVRRDLRAIAARKNLSDEERHWLIRQASSFQRRADAVTDRAIAWVERVGAKPFFLWVHYFDAHQPYEPPDRWRTAYDPEYRGELNGERNNFFELAARRNWEELEDVPGSEMSHMIALYDGEISFMDEQIGRLLHAVEKSKKEPLVVVVADHGEGFGEHGQLWEHNGEIFDEVMRVPLIIRRPDGAGAGTRIPGLVRTIDVAPTILEYAGLPAIDPSDGRSLLALTETPEAPAPGECLLEATRNAQIFPYPQSYLGLRTEAFKLIVRFGENGAIDRRELFDLLHDANEASSVDDSNVDLVEQWTRRVVDSYEAMATKDDLPQLELDPDSARALRALGYIE